MTDAKHSEQNSLASVRTVHHNMYLLGLEGLCSINSEPSTHRSHMYGTVQYVLQYFQTTIQDCTSSHG